MSATSARTRDESVVDEQSTSVPAVNEAQRATQLAHRPTGEALSRFSRWMEMERRMPTAAVGCCGTTGGVALC